MQSFLKSFFVFLFSAALWFVLAGHSSAQTSNVKLLGQLDPFDGNNRYADVWGEGNFAYLASYDGTGVMIVDITNPAQPKLAGHYNPATGGRFQDVVVISGIGYFSSESGGGIHIVDVRDPANPKLLSQITAEIGGYLNVHEVFVADGFLYEPDSRTTIVKIFDVRNPTDPKFVRDLQTTDTGFIHNVTVLNGRLYASGWGGKTDIYDVRNVGTQPPPLLGTIDSGDSSHSNWISSDGKLLASARETTNGDVRLFDISDPKNPKLLASITAESLGTQAVSAHNPYIVGNLLFVSWYEAGLQILDITDPANPKPVGSFDTYPGSAGGYDGCWGVYPFLGLDRVLISDLDGGLYIVDASSAASLPVTVSAASYKISAIAPKSIVAAFGIELATLSQAAITQPLPNQLAGTSVKVRDYAGVERAAPLFYVSPTQINYQIPAGTVAGPATVTITNANGKASTGTLIVAAAAPSLFSTDQSGTGAAAAQDGFTFTSAPFNATRTNGQPNILAFYGTGLGGDVTDADGNRNSEVTVTIDGKVAVVEYAGRAPGFAGLNQLNVVLPAGITSGNHIVTAMRNGVTSNAVTITIK